MLSMAFLCLLTLLAIFTPMLPLQSPIDKDLNNRRFLPPNLSSVVMGSRPQLKFAGGTLTGALAAFESEIQPLRNELAEETEPLDAEFG